MFECKYKFSLEDNIISAKYVYKSQKRKRDKIIAYMVPILFVCMVAMLIYDIATKRAYVWDIVLMVALLFLEVMYLLIPVMMISTQKKQFKKQKFDEMDYMLVKIDENMCSEVMVKDEQIVAQNAHSLKYLTSYVEDNERIVLIFNNIEFVCLRKNAFVGDLSNFKNVLVKAMKKSNERKK